MKTKLIVFFVFFSVMLFAQEANDRVMYMDNSWKEATKEKYTYYRIIKGYFLDKSEYRFEDYYKSGKLQMEGNSENKEYLTRNGLFKYYYENGTIKSEVRYEKGTSVGKRTDWYENGTKKMEGEYLVKDEKEREPKFKMNQFWSSQGKQEVVDGNGYLEDDDEDYSEKGNVVSGIKNGAWEGTSKKYKFTYAETYNNGELVSGKSIDSLKVEHNYTVVMLDPKPKKGLQHFYKFVGERFQIPRNSESISGQMFFTFSIDQDGDATDFSVVKSLGKDLDKEGIRVIKRYPDWACGEFRGVKIKVLYSIPIRVIAQE